MSRKNLNDRYINKKMDRYYRKQLEKYNNIDMEKSKSTSINKNISFWELLFGNARSRTTYKVSEKTNVTVMMENNQLVTMNVDSVRPT